MQFNVASLLKGPVGGTQRHRLEETSLSLDDAQAERVWGHITLMRVNDGIWASGEFRANVTCTCSRCLQPYGVTLRFPFDETYYPSMDINTGVAVSLPKEAEADAAIDGHHILDISEAMRQDIILATPMKPLCGPNCAGICSRCGRDLNHSPCACPTEVEDPRWATLLNLLPHRKT